MPRTCLLTDTTANFTKPVYLGHEHVYQIPHNVLWGGQLIGDNKDLSVLKSSQLAGTPTLETEAPTIDAFREMFNSLGSRYQEIVVILLSAQLSPAFHNAVLASQTQKSPATISVIDSLTTAVGLGLLVQTAAEALMRGHSGAEINHLVRGMTRRVYSVFCLPDLAYLAKSGQIEADQAIIGGMLGITPLYIMENGRLVHTQKVRSSRHLVDVLFEFVVEFENLKYLALLQGVPTYEAEIRNLRERISQNLRSVPLVDHTFSLSLATILGPHSIGMVAMEYSNLGE